MKRFRYYRLGIEFGFNGSARKVIVHFWRWSWVWG